MSSIPARMRPRQMRRVQWGELRWQSSRHWRSLRVFTNWIILMKSSLTKSISGNLLPMFASLHSTEMIDG